MYPRSATVLPALIGMLALLLCPLSLADTSGEEHPAAWRSMAERSLVIDGAGGSRHHLQVLIADDARERAQGMQHLSPATIREHPILFFYGRPSMVGWHMRNVRLALDIVYLDRRGRVIGRERMEPGGTGYGLDRPIVAALELAAGEADRYGLREGARVRLE